MVIHIKWETFTMTPFMTISSQNCLHMTRQHTCPWNFDRNIVGGTGHWVVENTNSDWSSTCNVSTKANVQLSRYYSVVIMGPMASQNTSLAIVYSTIYSGVDQWTHQSSASLAFVRGIHWWTVNSSHKWPVTQKMFPFDDVIMEWGCF